jgi:hypothetical protein
MKHSLLELQNGIQAFYAREERKEKILYRVANVALLVLAGVGVVAVWLAFH